MTRHLSYQLLDVFTETALSGNPLAVFADAHDLSASAMQRIAGELNLSETVFVTDGDREAGRFVVRIMTPQMELPFAGHPTIGTAVALAAHYRAYDRDAPPSIELVEAVGDIPVSTVLTSARIGRAHFTAPRPPEPVETEIAPAQAARLLSLETDALAADELRGWSAGVPFLFIPLASPALLNEAVLNTPVWQDRLAGSAAPHIYAYALDRERPDEVHARMFAPAMGIAEDPATGAAAVAFAGELAARTGTRDGALSAAIRQGEAMGRPGRLEIDATVSNGGVERVRLGGKAVLIGEGTLWLDV